jgi:hypothetical protein
LVRVVNAATDPAEKIDDILVVHDSFAVHAPNAVRLNQLIRRELGMMYMAGTATTEDPVSGQLQYYDPIAKLLRSNPVEQPVPPELEPPPVGELDPFAVLEAEWAAI